MSPEPETRKKRRQAPRHSAPLCPFDARSHEAARRRCFAAGKKARYGSGLRLRRSRKTGGGSHHLGRKSERSFSGMSSSSSFTFARA